MSMGYVRRAYHIWEQYNQDGILAEIRNGGTIKLQQLKQIARVVA